MRRRVREHDAVPAIAAVAAAAAPDLSDSATAVAQTPRTADVGGSPIVDTAIAVLGAVFTVWAILYLAWHLSVRRARVE